MQYGNENLLKRKKLKQGNLRRDESFRREVFLFIENSLKRTRSRQGTLEETEILEERFSVGLIRNFNI